MGGTPVPCAIPPIPDPATGAPTCPSGFYYDPVQKCCIALINTTVNPQDPCQASLLGTVADQEINFKNKAQLEAAGYKASNIIERFIVGLLEVPLMIAAPVITLAFSILDDSLALLGKLFLAAQAEKSGGYYRLAGALLEDMLNVKVDGDNLAQTFFSGGRVAAMRELGGKIVNTLAGEFFGTTQLATLGTFEANPGTGIGGLPDAQLSEQQGMKGLGAFLGFMTAFAIREGNTDFLASYIPHGYGEIFKDFAEDFAKNLGLGRLGRIAWKPLITTAIATPVQWAMNVQYRPKLFDPGQAYRALTSGLMRPDELQLELARQGWSAKRQDALVWSHIKGPGRAELRDLHTVGLMNDTDYSVWEGRDGRLPEITRLLDQFEDVRPARAAVLKAAEHFASELLLGKMPSVQFAGAINAIKQTATGQRLLTDGEVTWLLALQGIGVAGTRRHLSVIQLFRLYEDGLITLNEFSTSATELGYSPDDVRVLEQELLIAAQRAADRAARAARAAERGRLAKLTVAQMEAGYLEGILDLPTIEAELAVRQYTPDAIAALVAEFRTKAKLRPVAPPTA